MKQRYHSIANLALLLGTVAAATWWGLQLVPVQPPHEPVVALPAASAPVAQAPLDTTPVAGMFGPVATADAAPLRLVGVIATGGSGTGIALLAIGDQPSMAWRVGEDVDGHGTLVAVEPGKVVLKRGAATVEVALPAPKSSAEGIVPVH